MDNEKGLVQASRAGDAKAFESLVGKYQSMVCAITFSAVGRVDISEELAQETFLLAWRNLVQLKELDKFRYWLCSIARNCILNHYRKRQAEKVAYCDSGTLTELSAASESTPSDALISQEEQMILSQAILRMPEEYREPLVLFYRQGQSVKEVAITLELNEATVRTRLHRGRQMLKDEVAAMVERTLEKTGPSKAFTGAVMAAIGGLAIGTAATATAAAIGLSSGASTSAAGGASATATTAGLFTAAGVKVAAIAAAVILGAGALVYNFWNSSNPPAKLTAIAATSSQPQEKAVIADSNSKAAPAAVADTNTAQIASQATLPQLTPQPVKQSTVRHPDWPGISEPVQYYYGNLDAIKKVVSDANTVAVKTELVSMQENFGRKLWIKLPNQFRDENSDTILIDNGKERIEVDKAKKTVRRSASLASGDKPVYTEGNAREFIETANLFRQMQSSSDDPNMLEQSIITQIGTQEGGDILVYKIEEKQIRSTSSFDCRAYVDAVTLLPEKFVIIRMEEDGSTSDQQEEYIFDFSPIPDSVFSYQLQPDETLLPPKIRPGFSGRVVDMINNPVVGVDVFVSYFPLHGLDHLKGVTDNKGCFEIKIPDKFPHSQSPIHLPIYYWASLPNNPHFFAWTALSREDGLDSDANSLIPGFGGNIISEREMMTGTRTKNGISTPCQIPSSMLKEPVIRDVLLVMQTSGKISGVISDQNGYPIADAEIRVDFEAQTLNAGFAFLSFDKIKYSARSNQQGYYEVLGLPALWKGCRFYVYPSASGFVSEFHSIEINEPLVTKELNIKLHFQQVTIRGVLKDNYGVPLEKRSVSVSAPNMSINGCSTQTDPNGCFVIPGCPEIAGLKLNAYLSRNNNPFTMELNNKLIEKEKYLSFRYYPDVESEIAYIVGQKDYSVELTAIRPELELEITVIDSEGYPVPELRIQLDGKAERDMVSIQHSNAFWFQEKLQKRTDNEGVVKFDNIPDLKEMKICLMPAIPFIRQDQMLGANFKERQRLEKIDKEYKDLYHSMELPVPLVPGQKKYKMTIPILTEEEYKRQNKTE